MTRLFSLRSSVSPLRFAALAPLVLLFATAAFVGCGTTKFSDTGRTATEQLLISSAMEDVVDEYDYSRLAGLKIHIKIANSTTDSDYLKSLVRQQLAANGAFVRDAIDDADYVLEVAPGTVGTNRYELMYGIPETSIPAIGTLAATSIPEFALIKRTDQKAQVKLNMWAYNKTTGAIIWQSGVQTKSANIRDRWIFGAGPFTNASYDEAGMRLGADALPATIGERVSEDEKPSIQTGAVYQELDAAALERLKKIREDGLAQALAEEKADEAEQLGEVETEADADETNATVEESPTPAPQPEATVADAAPATVPAVAATPPAATVASVAATPPAATVPAVAATPPAATVASVAATPPAATATPSVFPDEPNLTLDFGNGAALPLRSVYVPNARIRR